MGICEDEILSVHEFTIILSKFGIRNISNNWPERFVRIAQMNNEERLSIMCSGLLTSSLLSWQRYRKCNRYYMQHYSTL